MSNDLEKIALYAGEHAIETATFAVNFGSPIDQADMRRFQEKENELRELYPAINDSADIRLVFGASPPSLPMPPASKDLAFFASNGEREWAGDFGDKQIAVSCRKYSSWERVWPQAEKRLNALLVCVDRYKPVASVDYGVIDTFRAARTHEILTPRNILKENEYISPLIFGVNDQRWDFSQGWFEGIGSSSQILVRLEGRIEIQNDLVVASIRNIHSHKFGSGISANDLLKARKQREPIFKNIFEEFRQKNKDILGKLLAGEMLSKMNLVRK